LWDVVTRKPRPTLAGHEGPIYTSAVRPRGNPPLLATAGLDRTVKLWDLDTQAVWGELIGHADSVNALAFSPDGAVLVSGGDDGEVRLWTVADRRLKRSLSAHAGAVTCLACAADGRHFASGGADGVRLWYADGTAAGVVTTEGRVRAVAFSPDGRTLAFGGDGATHLWDVGSRAERVTLAGDSTSARALAFTHDGRSFAAALGVEGQPGSVRVWDPVTGGERLTLPLPRDDLAAALVFSPAPAADGRHRLAVAGSAGRVTLWEAIAWGP
jgi:WD40 repeat protein